MLVSACQQDKDDLNEYVQRVKSQQSADIPPIPVVKPYEAFNYAANELRDPFITTNTQVEETVETIPDNGIKPDDNRRKELLESFALSDLQFVGSLEQEGLWGLIRSPDGVIHKVGVGNYMGMNNGKITAMTSDSINLKEIVLEKQGRYIERDTAISVIEVRQQ
jgi:type IV pilus assembly protein PilP